MGLPRHLIMDAAAQLLESHPKVSTLVTLSPIPGFGKWLQGQLACRHDGSSALNLVAGAHRLVLENVNIEGVLGRLLCYLLVNQCCNQ